MKKSYFIVDAYLKRGEKNVLNDTFIVKAEDAHTAADIVLTMNDSYNDWDIEVRPMYKIDEKKDVYYNDHFILSVQK